MAWIFEGGTTPSPGMIRIVKEKLTIGLYILIRPRGGDFIYSEEEFEIMLADIDYCKEIGVDGIVSGVLTKEGAVDVIRTKLLVEHSQGMDFTFHRAFDTVDDAEQALIDVISTGASRILTSGLENNVVEGGSMLKKLVEISNDEIIIMAGGGLKSSNMDDIIKRTGCNEYHSTAKTWVNSTSNNHSHVRMNGLLEIPEDKRMIASLDEVQRLKEILDKNFN